jgi:hypothetical protein
MDTTRMLKQREIVTKTMVTDVFECPSLDFTKNMKVEVTRGNEQVYLNGVLLKGLHLTYAEQRGNFIYCEPSYTLIDLLTPSGDRLSLKVDSVTFTEGHIPSTAKLVETQDSP